MSTFFRLGGGAGGGSGRFAAGGTPGGVGWAGSTFTAYRVGVPLFSVELFYAGASTDFYRNPLRSYGAEVSQRLSAIAALGTPDVFARTGVARAVDEPVKGKWAYYVTLSLRP